MKPRSPLREPDTGCPPRRVQLFATCLADRFFADACRDAVTVLRHFGVQVEVPEGQTCCGQPAYNSGSRPEAERMARHTVDVFAGAEHVVLPSGSCAAMIRGAYGPMLGSEAAHRLASRTFELSEFLVDVLGVLTHGKERLGNGLRGRSVVYHHGCHALRELGVHEAPTRLLSALGAEIVPWDGDTECCGFGGLFSAKFPAVSTGMADRKLDALPPAVDVVTSADGGCLLQLSGRWAHRREREGGRAAGASDAPAPTFRHLASVLREGLGSARSLS